MVNTSTPGGMDTLSRQIKDAPKAKGADRIWLPGEREFDYQARALVEGLARPADVQANLRGVAEDVGLTKPAWL